MVAPDIGGTSESSSSSSRVKYYAVNVGTYGIAAGYTGVRGEVTWLGNTSAVEKRNSSLGSSF
jgi:hypothetical protein